MKRKRLAADRSGLSKLKEGITATEMQDETMRSDAGSRAQTPSPKTPRSQRGDDDDDDDEDDEDSNDVGEEIDEDFLLSALEEELG